MIKYLKQDVMKTLLLAIALLTFTFAIGQEQNRPSFESTQQSQIKLYPTQSPTGIFKIGGITNERILRTEVHELSGKKVVEIDTSKSRITEGSTIQLNVDSGTYIASIVTDQGVIMRRIFVGRNYIN